MPRRFSTGNFYFPGPISFEPELFETPIGISVFGSETRITKLIASKICTRNNSYVLHLSSKIQLSTFSCFKVIAFFTSVAKFVIFSAKKHRIF